ncbi:unnamed protein product [Ixodes persulcatus]
MKCGQARRPESHLPEARVAHPGTRASLTGLDGETPLGARSVTPPSPVAGGHSAGFGCGGAAADTGYTGTAAEPLRASESAKRQ